MLHGILSSCRAEQSRVAVVHRLHSRAPTTHKSLPLNDELANCTVKCRHTELMY